MELDSKVTDLDTAAPERKLSFFIGQCRFFDSFTIKALCPRFMSYYMMLET